MFKKFKRWWIKFEIGPGLGGVLGFSIPFGKGKAPKQRRLKERLSGPPKIKRPTDFDR